MIVIRAWVLASFIPVIVLSADAIPATMRRLLDAGVRAYRSPWTSRASWRRWTRASDETGREGRALRLDLVRAAA